ncbi:hypothetical protein B0A48_07244 [Cryoendolithus antarcticus]|uniref:Uncharacterized protein n=1 Tax=Cryoendolithus antarcticus TaxID=1507870 RepID=A0A1V8T805_9PEZI|nr:hypothetical protein B0A48_07244 [Cryoendolithus antarcticus]
MAPARKIDPSVSPPDPITQETQTQTSQDLDMSAMHGLMEKHRKSVKARRRTRENAIREARQERMESIRQKLEAAVQRDDEQFRARRLPQVRRLCQLVHKKRQLEQAIMTSKTELDNIIEAAVKHLQTGIEKRKEAMEG